jgi:hypothetical protein
MTMGAVVVNGYFRSGTSILWRLLREGNAARQVVYEPCHNDLFAALNLARQGRINDLHAFPVWSHYLALSAPQLDRLRWAHPSTGGNVLPRDFASLANYVAVLRELFGADVVLQSNRWQFLLGELQRSGVEVLQVVRNPLAVYRSICRGSDYRRRRNPLVRARGLLNPAEQFYGWRMAREIAPRYGYRLSALQRFRPFEVFVYCWVLSNSAALQALGPGRVFSYEEICVAPERFQVLLETLDLAIDCSAMRRDGAQPEVDLTAVDATCRRLGITEAWAPLHTFISDNQAQLRRRALTTISGDAASRRFAAMGHTRP